MRSETIVNRNVPGALVGLQFTGNERGIILNERGIILWVMQRRTFLMASTGAALLAAEPGDDATPEYQKPVFAIHKFFD